MENIDKMISCGDPSFGGAMYSCPHCGKLKDDDESEEGFYMDLF